MKTVIRGRILTFKRAPIDSEDTDSYIYFDDGYVEIENQKISSIGLFSDFIFESPNCEYTDYRPNLIMPGFIDTHNHFPQLQVIASYGTQLLDWLKNYTFPEEAKFKNYNYAKLVAKNFINTLLDHGTTTSVSFCSVHVESVKALFEEAEKYNMCLISGKVMMDRNAPNSVLDNAQASYDQSKELISNWHQKKRARYAISPRFAITSSAKQLELAGVLASEFNDCYVQTHLSENIEEIELTLSLFPDRKNYLDIYMYHGLLGPKSLMGHSIHLDDYERRQMAETKAVAVHCPTSNLFLGSGLFDLAGFEQLSIRTAIATDTGGGTSFSMLRTLDEAYKIQQMQNHSLNPLQSIYWATLGNACALGLDNEVGSLKEGMFADIIVLDSRATALSNIRMETCENLNEELFVLQTLGDDRFIKAVYVAGIKYR